jgi:RNA polymerase sigma-70 factor, ECF subfamily
VSVLFRGAVPVQYDDRKEHFVASLADAQDLLYAYILSLFPDADLARDVLQETNIVLWRKADEFNEEMNFVAWACGIARFQVKARRRDMKRDKLIFNDALLDTLAVEAEQIAANDGFDGMLNECLNELTAQQRELLLHRYEPGGSLKRLASKLGRSVSGLGVSLFRIRQLLAGCMKRKIAGGD